MIIRHDTSISNIIYLHEIVLILDKPQTGHNSYSNVLDCSHIIVKAHILHYEKFRDMNSRSPRFCQSSTWGGAHGFVTVVCTDELYIVCIQETFCWPYTKYNRPF